MKKVLLTFTLVLMLSASAFAIPPIQLFVDGTYDWSDQTWVTTGNTIDLYIIASIDLDNIMISASLNKNNYTSGDNPNGVATVIYDGASPSNWVYGYSPYDTYNTWDNSDDLAKHSIFPTWYSEFNAGNFRVADGGGIGDVQPDGVGGSYWDPANTGYLSGATQQGEIRKFTVDISGVTDGGVHFDAYTVNADGSIQYFAPFSHDATTNVPEPGTMMLFAAGLAGAGLYRRMRKSA